MTNDTVKLAEVWQVDIDGRIAYEIRVVPSEQYRGDPTSADLWNTFVYIAVEDALQSARAKQPPVTPP